jgi:hypothetical protein
VGEGPGHWERLPPTGTRSHEGKDFRMLKNTSFGGVS